MPILNNVMGHGTEPLGFPLLDRLILTLGVQNQGNTILKTDFRIVLGFIEIIFYN